MVVGLLTVDLLVPAAHSLKEKRSVIRSLVERLRRRHNLSVWESDYHDLHGRSQIAAAWVGPNGTDARRALEHALNLAETTDGAEVIDWSIELLR